VSIHLTVSNTWGAEYALSDSQILGVQKYRESIGFSEGPSPISLPCDSYQALVDRGWITPTGLLRCTIDVELTFDAAMLSNKDQESPADVMRKMWLAKDYTDFFIVARSGEAIHCHRAVLAASSPVFQGMLSSDLHESLEKKLTIDEEAEDITLLLRYFYLCEVPCNITCLRLANLLRLADYYNVPHLLDVCVQRLIPLLSEDCIVEVLQCLATMMQSCSQKSVQILHPVIEQLRNSNALLVKLCTSLGSKASAAHFTSEQDSWAEQKMKMSTECLRQADAEVQTEATSGLLVTEADGTHTDGGNTLQERTHKQVHQLISLSECGNQTERQFPFQLPPKSEPAFVSLPGAEKEEAAEVQLPEGVTHLESQESEGVDSVEACSEQEFGQRRKGPHRKTRRGGKKSRKSLRTQTPIDTFSFPDTYNSWD